MARQGSSAQREEIYEENGIRRNPYLADYQEPRRRRVALGGGIVNMQASSGRAVQRRESGQDVPPTRPGRSAASRVEGYINPAQENGGIYRRISEREDFRNRQNGPAVGPNRSYPEVSVVGRARSRREEPEYRQSRGRQTRSGASRGQVPQGMVQTEGAVPRRSAARSVSYDLVPEARPASRRASAPQRRAAIKRKKKQALIQKLLVCAWVLCILVFTVVFAMRNNQEEQKEDVLPATGQLDENPTPQASGLSVQGIPAEKFAEHPEWTEDLLTPNEYSRPGNALEEVNNIFVHYTANPGTSAAQNRSYFEWQKDTHEASVSAHFVIGYEGEIIQCVPLDEIAYAVMTRNYDSISIECCYLEKDGSFTQATYDSLISLLAWLVDVYDLDSEDILRHYDCGGKKCPLYYTEHPGAWEQLKKDVDNL